MEKEKFIDICLSSDSMFKANKIIGMNKHKFKKLAIEYGCYYPNRGGKGIKKPNHLKLLTEDILNGKYPNYQTNKLKIRLIEEGYKENRCEECNITKWNEKYLEMQLHHIDGNNKNHKLENLRILCPNCHSQTDNFCGKNKNNIAPSYKGAKS